MLPTYNAQVAVDGEHQAVAATDLTANASDQGGLPALLDEVAETFGEQPETVLADAGYGNERDLAGAGAGRDGWSPPTPSLPAGRRAGQRAGADLRRLAGLCSGLRRSRPVAHCGGSMAGSFVWTLVLTDIASGWPECVPLLVREAHLMVDAVDQRGSGPNRIGRRRIFSTDCDGSTPGCSSRCSSQARSERRSAASATGAACRAAASSSPIRSERASPLLRHRAQPQTRTVDPDTDPSDPGQEIRLIQSTLTPRRARVSRSLTGSRGLPPRVRAGMAILTVQARAPTTTRPAAVRPSHSSSRSDAQPFPLPGTTTPRPLCRWSWLARLPAAWSARRRHANSPDASRWSNFRIREAPAQGEEALVGHGGDRTQEAGAPRQRAR